VLRVLKVLMVLRVLVLRVLTVLLVLGVSMAQAPQPAMRDGVITGQVVDGLSGKPVGAVIVSISGAALSVRTNVPGGFSLSSSVPAILTGSDGRFVFRDLPPGSFTVGARKGGYADGASGRRVIAGPSRPVVLTAAERTAETSIRIWKNAAITGTVVDEAGEPVVALHVGAVRRVFIAGRQRLGQTGWSVTTDDRGVYRLGDLPPGEYLVQASQPQFSANTSAFVDTRTSRASGAEVAAALPRASTNGIQVGEAQLTFAPGGAIPPPPVRGRVQIYPPIFYPSALAPAQAMTIQLAAGEERMGVDLQLQPVTGVRVAGIVMGASGPAGAVSLWLVPAGVEEMAPAEALAPTSMSDAAGSFTFVAVPPGQYTLRGSSRLSTPGPGPGGDINWVAVPIAVAGEDVDGVVATMRPALRITARLEFEGVTPKPPPQARLPNQFTPAPFTLEPDDAVVPVGMGRMAGVTGDQVFTLAGFMPGKYRVRVPGSPPGWMFKSAMLNGVDVSETAFEFTRDIPDLVLTFTDRWSGMGGTVQGAGAGGAMVLAFTTNPQLWENTGSNPRRLKNTRANAKGEFGLSSVPPGEYYVVAVPEEQAPPDWRDPKTLEALARLATQVSIGEGEHKMIDLRLKEVRQ
jgi:hypothetical protein